MTTSIMLDLETWGTRPGCDLRSIGACVFSTQPRHGGSLVHDGSLGTIRPFYIATDNPIIDDMRMGECGQEWYTQWDETAQCWRKYPLHRDPSTVQWWSEQSDEAQAAFTDPVDLRVALERFQVWLFNVTNDGASKPYDTSHVRIWSHGPQFDISILAAAYEAVGLPVPWHYRAPRDTRTAFDLAGIDDHSAWLAQYSGDDRVQHHALSDAICQARAVCAAYGRLQSLVEDAFHAGWDAPSISAASMRADEAFNRYRSELL